MKNTSLVDRRKQAADKVYKQFFLYLYKDIFGNFILETFNKLKDKQKCENYIKEYRLDLLTLMSIRRVPQHWFVTFCDIIEKGKINLPLHESIYLSVGDYPIINNDFDIEKVKQIKALQVSIEISSEVTNNQIRSFIELNADLILKIEKLLNLTKIETPRVDNYGEGVMTHLMLEAKKMTIKELLQKEHPNKTYNEEEAHRIAKMLRDYNRYLSSKK